MKITADTKAWDKLKKSMLKDSRYEVRVGWFPEHKYGSDNDNLQMAQVAQWQEEGTTGGQGNGSGIPPRPFMRVGLWAHLTGSRGKDQFEDVMYNIATGQSVLQPLKGSLKGFELVVKNLMQHWNSPPNAPSTIAQKGFNDPLIETGQLIDAVTAKVARSGGD